jgi:hypothetical protein
MSRYLIREVENGWTLTKTFPWEEEHRKVQVEVFEKGTEREEECEALQRLLWSVIDSLVPYDKWARHNVIIKIEAGHKVETSEEDEESTHA